MISSAVALLRGITRDRSILLQRETGRQIRRDRERLDRSVVFGSQRLHEIVDHAHHFRLHVMQIGRSFAVAAASVQNAEHAIGASASRLADIPFRTRLCVHFLVGNVDALHTAAANAGHSNGHLGSGGSGETVGRCARGRGGSQDRRLSRNDSTVRENKTLRERRIHAERGDDVRVGRLHVHSASHGHSHAGGLVREAGRR